MDDVSIATYGVGLAEMYCRLEPQPLPAHACSAKSSFGRNFVLVSRLNAAARMVVIAAGVSQTLLLNDLWAGMVCACGKENATGFLQHSFCWKLHVQGVAEIVPVSVM